MANYQLGLKHFAQMFQLVVLCRFMLRSYATHTVLPVSYSWSTFTGPVSGEVREVKSPWKQQSSTSYVEYKGSGDGSDLDYNPDYVVMYIFSNISFNNVLIVRIGLNCMFSREISKNVHSFLFFLFICIFLFAKL